MKKSNQIEENLLNRIIKVAYGEGNLYDRAAVNYLAKKNPEIKRLLEEYRMTSSVLDKIKNEACPDEVIEKAYGRITAENDADVLGPRWFDIILNKPLISAAAAVLIIGMFSLYIIERQEPKPQYSAVQVKHAEMQVKESLAIIDRVFQSTQRTLEYDVLKKRVSPPLNEGIKVVNNLFKGG